MAKVWDKERISGAARQKKITYKGNPIRLSADFSAETLQARRDWNDMSKSLKDKALRQEYSIQQKYPSDIMEKSLLSQIKSKGVCSHKTPSRRNLQEGLHISKKKIGRKPL